MHQPFRDTLCPGVLRGAAGDPAGAGAGQRGAAGGGGGAGVVYYIQHCVPYCDLY